MYETFEAITISQTFQKILHI